MHFAALPLALAAAFAAVTSAQAAQPTETRAQNLGFTSVSRGEDGRTDLISGPSNLRAANSAEVSALFKGELGRVVGLGADDTVTVQQVVRTEDGRNFHRSRQLYRGVPVWGDGFVVQTDAGGRVEAVFGGAIAISGLDVEKPRAASELYPAAVRTAMLNDGVASRAAAAGERLFRYTRAPELAVYAANGHAPTLAWDADVAYETGGRPFHARVFVDARSGALLNSYTFVQDAINRAIHNVNNACVSASGSGLPGALAMSEGGTSSDSVVNQAYRNSGRVYWWFRDAFGRDSFNGSGAKITVSVKATFQGNSGCSGDNAYWSGSQIAMGNGGSTFYDMNSEPDVIYHELGHAVTQYTSNLAYQNQSGGMNEASSDIYAAAVEAWMNTVSGEPGASTAVTYSPDANTWKLGEGLMRNGTAALRFMADPRADGRSLDHYTQYQQQYGSCSPSQNNDYCGVHLSSGIVNLAFYLLTTGGTHPRGGSTVQVTAIPFDRAIKYFYESHTSILQANDTFARLRNAMMTRARANGTVGACDEVRIGKAWDAVGVTGTAPANPNACSSGNQPPVASFTATPNGLTVSFNGSGSSDPDGSIASYSWNFGDNTTGSGASTSKTYTSAGTYSVSLTVTDNQGATNTTTKQVTVSGGTGGNQPPVASFTATPSGLTVSFNGSGSSDPDGSIASYSWSFGDSTTGSGASTSKTYSAAGTYSVSLTVTDNQGATNTSTQQVTVSDGGGSCPGASYYGNFFGGAGQIQYQPNGNYYQSLSGGAHTVCLTGPAGTDFDIYLDKWNGAGWTQVAKSESPTSGERIAYTGTAGYYVVRVVNFSGAGSYSLTLQKP